MLLFLTSNWQLCLRKRKAGRVSGKLLNAKGLSAKGQSHDMKLQTFGKLLSNLELGPCIALMLLAIAVSCKSFTTVIFLKYRCTVRCRDIIKAPGDVSVRHFFLTPFTPSFEANLNTLQRARICLGKILIWVGRELLPSLSPWSTGPFYPG